MKASFPRTLLFAALLLVFWPKTTLCLDSAKKLAHPDSESKSLDPGWPREVDRNGVRFVYYQPQVDEWKNLRELRARVAFTLTPKGEKPVVGIEELKGDTVANLEKRTVLINNIEIVAVRFPSLSDDEAAKMETLLKSGARQKSCPRISLNLLPPTVGNTCRKQLPPGRPKLQECPKSFSQINQPS